MLPLACAIAFAHTQGTALIPVKNTRPSHMISVLRGSEGKGLIPAELKVVADDPAGGLRVDAAADDVALVRHLVQLLDVPRPTMQLKMHIDSPADRLGYDVTTSLRSNQKWRMSDEETGITIAVLPRLNLDRTATLKVFLQYPGGSQEQTLRLKSGQKFPVVLGTQTSVRFWQTKEGEFEGATETTSLPKVTFQLTLPKR